MYLCAVDNGWSWNWWNEVWLSFLILIVRREKVLGIWLTRWKEHWCISWCASLQLKSKELLGRISGIWSHLIRGKEQFDHSKIYHWMFLSLSSCYWWKQSEADALISKSVTQDISRDLPFAVKRFVSVPSGGLWDEPYNIPLSVLMTTQLGRRIFPGS